MLLLDAGPFHQRSGSLTGNHDNATFSYPLRIEAARQWTEGRWPLWNPYSLAGTPLLGDITVAALYPGNLSFLLDVDGPRYRALDRVAALHFVLAAVFMYGFARTLALGRAASALAGLVFAGNGLLLFLTVRWIQTQNSAVWLPLILTAVHRSANRRGFWLAVLVGAVAVALQILAGYPQYTFYCGLLAGAWALMLALGRSGKGWRPLFGLAAMYALGAALAAVQLAPTIELVSMSARGGPVSLGEFLHLAASPNFLAGLAIPRALVSPTSPFTATGAAFMGTLAVVLAIEGARSTQRERLFLGVALVVTFLLAVGPSTPVGWLTYQIPGFNAFRYPFKHLLEFSFCIAALAGFGAQSLIDRRRGATTCVAVAASLACGWLALTALQGARHWTIVVSAVASLGFVLLVVSGRRRAAIALALVSVWLGMAGNRDAALLFMGSRAMDAGEMPGVARTLTQRTPTVLGPRYVATVWTLAFQIVPQTMLALDYPAEFRVPAVHGTSPFLWKPLGAALSMTDNGNFTLPRIFHDLGDQSWDVLAVQYFGSFKKPLTRNVIHRQPGAVVAERVGTLPALRFVDRAECMEPEASWRELHRRKYDLGAVALLDCADRPPLPELDPSRLRAKIALVQGEPGLLRMRVRLGKGRPGLLVVSQSDMPGWRAWIDGQPAPIYRAYGLVQAIVVPAGQHEVVLEYHPASFALGAKISLAALVVLLGVGVMAVRSSAGDADAPSNASSMPP